MTKRCLVNIGIDIDGCIFDTASEIISRINSRYGLDVKLSDIKSYNIEKYVDIPKDEFNSIVEEVISLPVLTPYTNAVESILRIRSLVLGPLYFISSRKKKYYDSTYRLIADTFGFGSDDFKLILIGESNNDSLNKLPPIKENNISIFIEDRAAIAKKLIDHTDVILIRRPWNEHLSDTARIIVVDEWPDVFLCVGSLVNDLTREVITIKDFSEFEARCLIEEYFKTHSGEIVDPSLIQDELGVEIGLACEICEDLEADGKVRGLQ